MNGLMVACPVWCRHLPYFHPIFEYLQVSPIHVLGQFSPYVNSYGRGPLGQFRVQTAYPGRTALVLKES